MKIGISDPVLPRYCRLSTGRVATARSAVAAAIRRAGDIDAQIRSARGIGGRRPSGLRSRGLGRLGGLLRSGSLRSLGRLLCGLPLLRRLHAELLVEPFDPALGIDQLLPAREERMAGGTDLKVQLGLGRPRLERVAAGATDLDH